MTEGIIPDPRPDMVSEAVQNVRSQPAAADLDFSDVEKIIGAGSGNIDTVSLRAAVDHLKQQPGAGDVDFTELDQIIGAGSGN